MNSNFIKTIQLNLHACNLVAYFNTIYLQTSEAELKLSLSLGLSNNNDQKACSKDGDHSDINTKLSLALT